MTEQDYKDEAEKIRQEQEESDALAKLEEERLAELEWERLVEEEDDRLKAQEAVVEARRQGEAEQRQLEEDRRAKEEEKKMQEAATSEEPHVFVAPKKKKKGAKYRKGPLAGRLASEPPPPNADTEEWAVMEEIKLSEEDKLEAELKQLEAEEAEWLNGTDAKKPGIAEAAEDEHINRELLEEERRWLVAEEDESVYLHYLALKEAAVVAEERLSIVQAELDAVETQKMVILQQAESVREQEASCRYHVS
jgi:hypothetical protein